MVLIASQVVRNEIGLEFPQEVDFKSVYAAANVFCEELRTPENARRLAAAAAQAAIIKRGVAILIVPAGSVSPRASDGSGEVWAADVASPVRAAGGTSG